MTCVSRQTLSVAAAALLAVQAVFAQSPREGDTVMRVHATVYGEDVVRGARQYLGVRYLLGGSTPRAFDCSGFVRYVFGQYGILMPRTAHEQSAYGSAPSIRELQPGDLLFFYGGLGAQHVAIYAGRDSIIHASSSGRRVKLDRLSGSRAAPTWFGRRLIAVRRILPATGEFDLPSSLSAAPQTTTATQLSASALAPSLPH